MRKASIISRWCEPAPSDDGGIVLGRSPRGFLRFIYLSKESACPLPPV